MNTYLRSLFFLFAFAALCGGTAQAQTEFKEGFIIRTPGDTLKGLTGNRTDLLNGRVCLFKPSLNATVTEFTAKEIAGYGLADGSRYYESHFLNLPADSGHFFLNTLVKGKASIYMFRDKNSTDHYIMLKSNGEIEELLDTDTTLTDQFNGTRWRRYNQEYKKQIAFAFTDCVSLMERIDQSRLVYRDMLKLFTLYNECAAPEQIVYIKPKAKSKAVFGFIVAPGLSALKVEGEHFFASSDLGMKALFNGGIFLNITLPRISDRISIQPEIMFSSVTYKDEFTVKAARELRSTDYDVELSMQHIKVPVSIRYSFPGKKMQPYIRAGLTNAFMLSYTNKMKSQSNYYGIISNDEGPIFGDLRGHEQGYFGGLGITSVNNKLFMEFRYEKTNGFSPYGNLSSDIINYQILIGIGL